MTLFALGALVAPNRASDEGSAKGSKAFQYLEYLKALNTSSYAGELPSCDLSPQGLVSQGVAVQYVLCDPRSITESSVCPQACKDLIQFVGDDCLREVATVETELASAYTGGANDEEIDGILTWYQAYQNNQYLSTSVVLGDQDLIAGVVDELTDSLFELYDLLDTCEED